MSKEKLFQVVEYEAISFKDEDFRSVVEEWFEGDIDAFIPKDVVDSLTEEGAYLVCNVATDAVGAVPFEVLTLNFEEYHPSEGFKALQKTVIEKVIDTITSSENDTETEDFHRGVNSVLKVLQDVQGSGIQ